MELWVFPISKKEEVEVVCVELRLEVSEASIGSYTEPRNEKERESRRVEGRITLKWIQLHKQKSKRDKLVNNGHLENDKSEIEDI